MANVIQTKWHTLKEYLRILFDREFMSKGKIRLSKYSVWLLVNFVICILPIVLAAVISQKFDDNIFVSFVSYSYTLLISSLYVFKSIRNSELVDWFTYAITTIILVGYILFPNLLNDNANKYIREHFVSISIMILTFVLAFSFLLNFHSIEDQVERVFSEQKQKKAQLTGKNVQSFVEVLKNDKE
jgi:hypothetical protein